MTHLPLYYLGRLEGSRRIVLTSCFHGICARTTHQALLPELSLDYMIRRVKEKWDLLEMPRHVYCTSLPTETGDFCLAPFSDTRLVMATFWLRVHDLALGKRG